VKKNYQTSTVAASIALPETIAVRMTNLADELREGLLALAVGTGLQVMDAMLEESVTALCGPKGRHDPSRTAVRHGHEDGSVALGGRKVPVRRPRVRSADGSGEVVIPAYEHFSSTEVLGAMAMEKMLAKLSTRRYPLGLEPVGTAVEQRSSGKSRSAVSRRFVERTEHSLAELMAAPLRDLDLVALMVDGVHFADHLCVVAMGIDVSGIKHPLAVVEGDTENATVVKDLFVGLRDRGLDMTRPVLVVIDGAKALDSAVKSVFDHPVIARCQFHKIRNVEAKLNKTLAQTVSKKMRTIYHYDDALKAEAELEELARQLQKSHPGAAGSVREGLTETLTVTRLKVPPTLARSLRSTNAIESMIEICRDHSSNVKRWRDGEMGLRWCAAGMGEAAKQFRKVNGFLTDRLQQGGRRRLNIIGADIPSHRSASSCQRLRERSNLAGFSQPVLRKSVENGRGIAVLSIVQVRSPLASLSIRSDDPTSDCGRARGAMGVIFLPTTDSGNGPPTEDAWPALASRARHRTRLLWAAVVYK
jgi:transposase-like protein